MPTIDLNILQERELARLLDYERASCITAPSPIAPTTTCR